MNLMTNHPITPPPELVQQWWEATMPNNETSVKDQLCTQAARWGSDQELEACCAWFQEFYKTESWVKHDLKHFRTTRRPKPPSLKEQALALINSNKPYLDDTAMDTIRRALEQLND
jgi:hypothetical protein